MEQETKYYQICMCVYSLTDMEASIKQFFGIRDKDR